MDALNANGGESTKERVQREYDLYLPLGVAQSIACPSWWAVTPETPLEASEEMRARIKCMLDDVGERLLREVRG